MKKNILKKVLYYIFCGVCTFAALLGCLAFAELAVSVRDGSLSVKAIICLMSCLMVCWFTLLPIEKYENKPLKRVDK